MNFDHKHIIPRYTFVIILMTLVGVAVIATAAYSMFFEKSYWEKVRERLASRQKDIPAVRGNIYSADGQLLVGSMPIYTLYADLVVVDQNDSVAERRGRAWRDTVFVREIDSLCIGLNQLFPKKSVAEYKTLLHKAYKNAKERERGKKCQRTFVLARNASYIQYREFLKLPYVRYGRNKSGFYGEEIPQRQKPYGNMATRTLGSLLPASDSAMNGLELAYDSILRGVNGKKHREKVRRQWMDRTDVEPINGLDIISTIDVGMQDAAEKILVRKLHEVNGEVGVVVLMEVATGDVKAIVNMTRLGTPGNYYYAEVKNNAITDLWEPGSTFKTASIMVALEDGVVTRKDSVQVGNGQYLMHGRVMKDHNWRKGGYGRRISVDECLMFSSNVGVSRIIDENYFQHPEKYVDGLHREGVGVPFTLPFQGQGFPSVRRPKPDGSNWSKTALAWMSIGYETQIPPIYTVTFYNAIANNGRMVKPRFVREIRKDGMTLKSFPVEVVKEQICKPSTLKDIHEILERVVNDPTGLGKKAGCKQFKVCGKTGTAQVADEHGSYHGSPARYMVSFCGFYPSEAPQYSCIVCIKKSGLPASGGGQCGPVFSELAQYVMAKGVFREVQEAADSTSVFERPEPAAMPEAEAGTVPNVVGLGARDAVGLLEALGLKVRLQGQGRVYRQNMPAGTKAVKGQTITLELRAM
ncbi:MAG: transpeptidase family protein [Bacteroidaceae bacterium]|nr:transpeptidase family protein [Bacteroidaceae bacterium]